RGRHAAGARPVPRHRRRRRLPGVASRRPSRRAGAGAGAGLRRSQHGSRVYGGPSRRRGRTMHRQGMIIGGCAALLLPLLPPATAGATPEGATPTCNGVPATIVVDFPGPIWEGTEQRDVIVVVGPISLIDIRGL